MMFLWGMVSIIIMLGIIAFFILTMCESRTFEKWSESVISKFCTIPNFSQGDLVYYITDDDKVSKVVIVSRLTKLKYIVRYDERYREHEFLVSGIKLKPR